MSELTTKVAGVLTELTDLTGDKLREAAERVVYEVGRHKVQVTGFADNTPLAVARRLRAVVPSFERLGVDSLFLTDVKTLATYAVADMAAEHSQLINAVTNWARTQVTAERGDDERLWQDNDSARNQLDEATHAYYEKFKKETESGRR